MTDRNNALLRAEALIQHSREIGLPETIELTPPDQGNIYDQPEAFGDLRGHFKSTLSTQTPWWYFTQLRTKATEDELNRLQEVVLRDHPSLVENTHPLSVIPELLLQIYGIPEKGHKSRLNSVAHLPEKDRGLFICMQMFGQSVLLLGTEARTLDLEDIDAVYERLNTIIIKGRPLNLSIADTVPYELIAEVAQSGIRYIGLRNAPFVLPYLIDLADTYEMAAALKGNGGMYFARHNPNTKKVPSYHIWLGDFISKGIDKRAKIQDWADLTKYDIDPDDLPDYGRLDPNQGYRLRRNPEKKGGEKK